MNHHFQKSDPPLSAIVKLGMLFADGVTFITRGVACSANSWCEGGVVLTELCERLDAADM
jgi:hypothetical protein